MVFGVFDGLHEGHRAMLKEARKYGNYLIAVVMPDLMGRRLKGRVPKLPLKKRIAALKKEKVDKVVVGDAKMGSWQVLKKYQPKIVACGYDQRELKEALKKKLAQWDSPIKVVQLKAWQPNEYHSRLISNKSKTC